MKKIILMVVGTALLATGYWVVAREKKDEPTDPNLPYQFRKRCTAYVESNPDRTSPYRKYYIGECVFQFDFHANTNEPVNIIPLYQKYADTPKHYPAFNPEKCTLNLRKKKFNFSRWHPQWYNIPNNQIIVKKVEDENGHKFSFTADITSGEAAGSQHTITAEVVCVGPSMADVSKHMKKIQQKEKK